MALYVKTPKRTWYYTSVLILVLTVLAGGCVHKSGQINSFGELFARVQMAGIFPDSKTFPDCIPKYDTARIIADYNRLAVKRNFDLHAFVLSYFRLPAQSATTYHFDSLRTVPQHIDSLWKVLTRQTSSDREGSLIPLPYAYVVPGGRFREVYYWDSYFTMLGLKASRRDDLIRDMTGNFAYLLHQYGFIPNGNRTYYLSRSQPPFFSMMVELLAGIDGDSVCLEYLSGLKTEYRFWMDGLDSVSAKRPTYRRIVRVNDTLFLNRYWDDRARPRPESFREDSGLALHTPRDPADLYRNLRAACESGWDFSSRWLSNPDSLGTIITTHILPVDLNCLLWHLETTLARACRIKGQASESRHYQDRADRRKAAIQSLFWDTTKHFFVDYNFMTHKPTGVISPAGMYPLFFSLAGRDQAGACAKVLIDSLSYPYGIVTSRHQTGQQWDYPNGWPPLQYMTVEGLKRYGMDHLAGSIRERFTRYVLYYLSTRHKFVEKYNVVEGLAGKGGEYPAQDGFGWTNGVIMQFLDPAYDTIPIADLKGLKGLP